MGLRRRELALSSAVNRSWIRGAVSGGSFSPSQFGSALAGWYDAALSTLWQDSARTTRAVADADPVGSWDDLSGLGRHKTQATTTQRGTLKLGIVKSHPSVRFDGVDDFLGVAVGGGVLNQPAWEFVAFMPLSVAIANQTVLDGGAQNESRFLFSTNASMSIYAGGVQTFDTFTVTTGTVYIAACRFNGVSSSLQINNRAVATGNAGTSAVTGLRTGGDGSLFSNTDILERFRVQGDISQAIADKARNYLNRRYGAF